MSSTKKQTDKKRKAKMIIRVNEAVKAAIQAYAGQLRLKNPGKRITEGEAIADLVSRCEPDIWNAIPEGSKVDKPRKDKGK